MGAVGVVSGMTEMCGMRGEGREEGGQEGGQDRYRPCPPNPSTCSTDTRTLPSPSASTLPSIIAGAKVNTATERAPSSGVTVTGLTVRLTLRSISGGPHLGAVQASLPDCPLCSEAILVQLSFLNRPLSVSLSSLRLCRPPLSSSSCSACLWGLGLSKPLS